jgi:hypothetical protein
MPQVRSCRRPDPEASVMAVTGGRIFLGFSEAVWKERPNIAMHRPAAIWPQCRFKSRLVAAGLSLCRGFGELIDRKDP